MEKECMNYLYTHTLIWRIIVMPPRLLVKKISVVVATRFQGPLVKMSWMRVGCYPPNPCWFLYLLGCWWYSHVLLGKHKPPNYYLCQWMDLGNNLEERISTIYSSFPLDVPAYGCWLWGYTLQQTNIWIWNIHPYVDRFHGKDMDFRSYVSLLKAIGFVNIRGLGTPCVPNNSRRHGTLFWQLWKFLRQHRGVHDWSLWWFQSPLKRKWGSSQIGNLQNVWNRWPVEI